MDRYRVKPGRKIRLKDWDPNDTSAFDGGKKEARAHLDRLSDRMAALQEVLYAQHKHKVLIVLQGMDCAGKDGAIRRVFEGVNPQGVRVANFKVPSAEELDHDYLWRVHKQAPATGEIAIFNRSHYGDVLVVRVHGLVARKVWSRRYTQINDFERMLAEEGTTVLKFFLHIDLEEQKARLQARLDEPDKRWKFNVKDLDERKRWPDYMRAYEDVLNQTSTKWAPWFLVPANRKWYRDLVIGSAIVETLEGLNMKFPKTQEGLDDVVIE